MIVISFVNGKGGVGKSTACVNLAASLSGAKTLILDCDPQRSSMDWFESRPDDLEFPKCEAMDAKHLPSVITQAAEQGYDYVFVDSAGRDAPSNKLIADMSDIIIMPSRPSAFDIVAMDKTISGMTKDRHKVRIVINQGFAQGQRNETAKGVLSGIEGAKVSPVTLISRAIYQDSGAEGLSVTEMEPSGKAATEINELWEWLTNER